jgi:hypothetical protein
MVVSKDVNFHHFFSIPVVPVHLDDGGATRVNERVLERVNE